MQQRGRRSSEDSNKMCVASKPSRARSSTSRGRGTDETGSTTGQKEDGTKSGQHGKTSPAPRREPDKNDDKEDGKGSGSRSSSSSSSSSSRSESRSPSRPVSSHSPVRATSPHRDYHLRYTDNDEVRQWLKSKNLELKRQKKEKKRAERSRRLRQEEEQQAKEERRKQSEILVQKWMEDKKMEIRMLNKRQQQIPKTIEHPQESAKPAKIHDEKNPVPVKNDKSKVPLFSRLGKYNTFPGAGTWKAPDKKLSEVERRRVYGDWLGKNRSGSLSTKDEDKIALVVKNKENKTKTKTKTSSQYVPEVPDKGPEKDRRCRPTSAGTGLRQKGEGHATPKLHGRRPRTSKRGRIGARLEPQGSDRQEPHRELGSSVPLKPEENNVDNMTPVPEVRNMKMQEKRTGSSVERRVSFEFEHGKTLSGVATSRDEDLDTVPEGQKNSSEVKGLSFPKTHCSLEVQSKSQNDADIQDTTRASDLADQKNSPARQELSPDSQEKENSEHTSEDDPQQKTQDTGRTSAPQSPT